MVERLKRLYGTKVSVVWVLLVLVLAVATGGYLAYDLSRHESICDAQTHPEVEYAFTFDTNKTGFVYAEDGWNLYGYPSEYEFYVLKKSTTGVVYEVDTIYSPPEQRLQRDLYWKASITSDTYSIRTEWGYMSIDPAEDYAKLSSRNGNFSTRVPVKDCGDGKA